MTWNRDLVMLGLFCVHVAVFAVLFAVDGGSLLTLVVGVNIGAGLTGAGIYGVRALGPERWQLGPTGATGEGP